MMKLHVVQARYGDCLILECQAGSRTHYILVDGGPSGVYRPYLLPVLETIRQQGGKLDLVVLTHIDSDHIIGLVDFLRDYRDRRKANQPAPIEILGIWHNAFDQVMPEVKEQAQAAEQEVTLSVPLDDPQVVVSYDVEDGERLQIGSDLLGIKRNQGFRGADRLVQAETIQSPLRRMGIRLWVLGPTADNLETLKAKWMKWLNTNPEEVSFGVGEEAPVKPDDSVNNLSSIMLLAESRGRRILLTGDGLGSDVVTGLERCGLLKAGETFHVDILKLPHHGSSRNVVGPNGRPEEFFDRVQADTYIISADGRYDNPDWDTLVWLTDAACRQKRKIEIFATNDTQNLKRLREERPEAAYFYHLTIMDENKQSEVL